MLNICGFNGFGQITSILTHFSCVPKDCGGSSTLEFQTIDVHSLPGKILISWSYILLYTDDCLWLFGIGDSTEESVKIFNAPEGYKLWQVSCARHRVICTTTDGGCWQLDKECGRWKDLAHVLWAQLSDDHSCRGKVVKACCGETVTAFLTEEGEVFNFPNKLKLAGVRIVDVCCGRSHLLLLSDKGEVYSAGEGSRGQLGDGGLEGKQRPSLVEGLAGLRVVGVACGGWHSCALTADGDLYTWGWDVSGQLGAAATDSGGKVSVQAVPRVVDWPGGSAVRVVRVACGARHTVALLDSGGKVSVQAVPRVVDWPGGSDVRVVRVACGARHTVALLEDGSVWGCGWNKYGQLALPGEETVNQMTRLPALEGSVQEIVCGPWNTCLVTT